VIHGHHTAATMAALAANPGVPALFISHSAASAFDTLPPHPRVRRVMAVDELCRARLVADGARAEDVGLLGNAVDLSRMLPHPPLPSRPTRAIAMTKHANHLPAVRAACRQAGISLAEFGAGPGKMAEAPERLFAEVDLVFATARIALEAAAAGCGVVVCDGRGLAGFLTAQNARAWRNWNLGAGVLHEAVSVETVSTAIAAWSTTEAAAATAYIRDACSLETQLDELEVIYRELAQSPWQAGQDAEALATGAFIAQWTPHFDHQAPWRRLADQVAFPPVDSQLDGVARAASAAASAVAGLDTAQGKMEARLAAELARSSSEIMNMQLEAQTHHASALLTAMAEQFNALQQSMQLEAQTHHASALLTAMAEQFNALQQSQRATEARLDSQIQVLLKRSMARRVIAALWRRIA
jgi:hypothetical protein